MSDYNDNIVSALTKQKKVAVFQLIAELPNLIALIVLAILSESLILAVDALGSVTLMIQAWIVFVISRKLIKNENHQYDYGMGKFESFGGLIANLLLQLGLVAVLFSSFLVLFRPHSPSDILIFAIMLKIVNTSFDVYLYFRQRKISKMMSGKLIDAEHHLMKENLVFDFISLFAILIMYIFREGVFVVYFEPVVCIIYASLMIMSIIKPLKQCAYDLLDKTIDEDIQLKITTAMAKGFDLYDSFKTIRTRSSGQQIYVDLLLGFNENKTYGEIQESFTKLEALVKDEVPNCIVSFVITSDSI
ncbi:MAG: cation transporter [Oscillospiraceae bacterium]|jgi:divalent metal cation (Fe/Co/Zn/Cd) transporter|nr:cation transporter [Oscillospiraceae bacterium]